MENYTSYQKWGKSWYELEKQQTDASAKMSQMLEQFDKDYKATTIKMLQWAVTNSLDTNEQI